MEFRLASAYYYCDEPEYLEIISPYVTRVDGENRYIEVTTLEELKGIVEDIHKQYEEKLDNNGWPPTSILINFDRMSILLRDYYIE